MACTCSAAGNILQKIIWIPIGLSPEEAGYVRAAPFNPCSECLQELREAPEATIFMLVPIEVV